MLEIKSSFNKEKNQILYNLVLNTVLMNCQTEPKFQTLYFISNLPNFNKKIILKKIKSIFFQFEIQDKKLEFDLNKKIDWILENSLEYIVCTSIHSFFEELIKINFKLKYKKNYHLIVIEEIDFFDQTKNTHKTQKDIFVANSGKKHCLGLRPYEKIYQLINLISTKFNLPFVCTKSDNFYKGDFYKKK